MSTVASVDLKCHVCDSVITSEHEAYEGLLVNAARRAAACLIEHRERLANLKKKRWSKQHAKQREIDLKMMEKLELLIELDEKLQVTLNAALKERERVTCHG